jgi:hypothetical protein
MITTKLTLEWSEMYGDAKLIASLLNRLTHPVASP